MSERIKLKKILIIYIYIYNIIKDYNKIIKIYIQIHIQEKNALEID